MKSTQNFTARFEMHGIPQVLNFEFDLNKGNHKTVHGYLSQGIFYEPDLTNLMIRALRPGDLAIDIGANLGCHSLFMSKFVGSTGRVFAFEPDPRNLSDFKKNLSLNDIANINLFEIAVSNRKGKVNIVSSNLDGGWSAVSIGENDNFENSELIMDIPTSSLDEIVKWNKVRLAKIDVEGYEGEVLDGAENIINQQLVDFWIIEYAPHCLSKFGEDQWSIRNRFKSSGYDCFVLTRSGEMPLLVPRETRIVSPDVYVINLLFCRQEKLSEIYREHDFTKFIFG